MAELKSFKTFHHGKHPNTQKEHVCREEYVHLRGNCRLSGKSGGQARVLEL